MKSDQLILKDKLFTVFWDGLLFKKLNGVFFILCDYDFFKRLRYTCKMPII